MTKTNQAKCANAIKKELKTIFPKQNFSVKSESGSMTNSVSVSWEDGPTENMVDEICKKYQLGSFDGMTDSYNFDNKEDNLPKVYYVHSNRKMSDETQTSIIDLINKTYDEKFKIEDLNAWNEGFDCWNNIAVYRKFNKMNLYAEEN